MSELLVVDLSGFMNSGKYLIKLHSACKVQWLLTTTIKSVDLASLVGNKPIEESFPFAVFPCCHRTFANRLALYGERVTTSNELPLMMNSLCPTRRKFISLGKSIV